MNVDFIKLKTFYLISKHGSFTAAADILHLTKGAVSRHLSQLEEILNIKLVERTTKSASLTEAGNVFYQRVEKILSELEASLTDIRNLSENIGSTINISVTTSLISTSFLNDISDFIRKHSDIRFNIISTEKDLDLNLREIDVSIQPFNYEKNRNIVCKSLIRYETHLYAGSKYVFEKGEPKNSSDLKNHQIISFSEGFSSQYKNINWHLSLVSPSLLPFVTLDSGLGMLRAVENNLGIGPLSVYGANTLTKSEVVKILPEISGPCIELFYAYHKEHEHAPLLEELYSYLSAAMIGQDTPQAMLLKK